MTEQDVLPNDHFWCDPREGQFAVTIKVEATIRETFGASSSEEARKKALAMIVVEGPDVCGADVEDALIQSVVPERPMYLVFRPGTTVTATSHIHPGDQPRAPKDDYERRTYKQAPTAKATGADQ